MSKPIGHKNNPACTGIDKIGRACPLRGQCLRFQIVTIPTEVYFEWAPVKFRDKDTPDCKFYIEKLSGKSFVAIDSPK